MLATVDNMTMASINVRVDLPWLLSRPSMKRLPLQTSSRVMTRTS